MNKKDLVAYLERIDAALQNSATLHVYGSAACILLNEPDRTSLDVDVAGPYSRVDERDLRQAAEAAGLPVNPPDDYRGDHIEWIGPLRLCLQPPTPETTLSLWQGAKLRIETGSVADLVASKLIRYDEIDQSDIRYLLSHGRVPFSAIESAVLRLPATFSGDPLVRDHLLNLKSDLAIWGVG